MVAQLIFFHLQGQGIDHFKNYDYSKVDSIALANDLNGFKTANEAAIFLTKDLTQEHEKYRVILRWIANNISYNYRNRSTNPDKVFLKRKGVCSGYSELLKSMLSSVGIQSEVINGYSKTSLRDIPKRFTDVDHAWNAVKLNDTWYLADATWASGTYDYKKRKFNKKFNESYFIANPEFLIKNHFPKQKEWQLLDSTHKRTQFYNLPIIFSGYDKLQIVYLGSSKGIIKIKEGNLLEFELNSLVELNTAILCLNDGRTCSNNILVNLNDCYKVKWPAPKKGSYELDLFVNGLPIARYKLIVTKPRRK